MPPRIRDLNSDIQVKSRAVISVRGTWVSDVFCYHAKACTQHAGRRMQRGRIQEDTGYRGTDWMDHPFRSFFLSFFNFFLLPVTFRIQSTDNGIGRLDRNGWVDGRTGWGVALVDGRRRSEDLAEAYPLPLFSPSTLLAGQAGRSCRAQFSLLARGPCVPCIRWDMVPAHHAGSSARTRTSRAEFPGSAALFEDSLREIERGVRRFAWSNGK